jgi:hypothetical protein
LSLDPNASVTRVSNQAFFSDGPDRVYVPTSAVLWNSESVPEPIAPYDAIISGGAFAREWMHRHVRYVTEMGSPSRAGGGPALAVIAVVLMVAAFVATVVAAITLIICAAEGLEGDACVLSAFFSNAAKGLGYGESAANSLAKQYGTNQQ